MKAVFLILVSVALVAAKYEYTDAEEAQYKGYIDACVAESKADANVISNIDKSIFPDSYTATNCYYKCLFKKFGILSDSDELLMDKVKGLLKPEVTQEKWEVLEKCMKAATGDVCEKTFDAHKCYVKFEEDY